MGHLQADLVSESHLRGKVQSETAEFAAAAHSYAPLIHVLLKPCSCFKAPCRYEHDSAHVLEEEDAIEKQLHSDIDVPDQQEVHKALLDAHLQQEKEHTALGKVGLACDV